MGGDDGREPRSGDGNAGAAEEVSLSVEETNKLRASLGLPPLKVGPSAAEAAAGDERRKRARDAADRAAAADLEERVRTARERRRHQETLDKTKTLGEAGEDVDDVSAWVAKTRTAPKRLKTSGEKAGTKRNDAGDVDGDDDGTALLAGAKVKIGARELEAGDEVVLTLEDQPILDDKGQLVEDDELALENVLMREQKLRDKAYRESGKSAKPLWEEDGKRRSLLDKYDEEEEEALELDEGGEVEADRLKRQEDVKSKLEAAAAAARHAGQGVGGGVTTTTAHGGDYYTAEEMAAMRKPKKKKKERKLKKKALTAEDLDALEAAAAARPGDNLGTRADRERRAAQRVADVAAADQANRQRFDAALSKANAASMALRPEAGDEDDDEDDELQRSLRKARELAAKKARAVDGSSNGGGGGVGGGGANGVDGSAAAPTSTADQLARQLAARRREREQREAELRAAAAANGGAVPGAEGGLTFTDVGEFMRGIAVVGGDGGLPSATPVAAADGSHARHSKTEAGTADDATELKREETVAAPMEVDEERGPAGVKKEEDEEMTEAQNDGKQHPKAENDGAWSSWVPADDTASTLAAEEKKAKRSYRRRATDDDERAGDTTNDANGAVVGDQAIGAGLGGALAFLKERGELNRPVEWAGRNSDTRDSYFSAAMGGYKDVFTGGRTDDKIALDVETALTRTDEYGRVLTPKEAFRQLCHDFHGIRPSRNTRERRERQIAKELAQRRTATGVAAGGSVQGLKAVQAVASTPFVVLSGGQVKPGQSRNAAGGHATTRDGGGSGAMPPPPPRRN